MPKQFTLEFYFAIFWFFLLLAFSLIASVSLTIVHATTPEWTSTGAGDSRANGDWTAAGTHNGQPYYTNDAGWFLFMASDNSWCIGSVLPGGPYFVVSKNIKHNRLIVSKNEKQLNQNVMNLTIVNFVTNQLPKLPVKVMAKIRSTQELSEAVLQKDGNIYKLVFTKPQRAVTSGQVAVFYSGNVCLGGGIIS